MPPESAADVAVIGSTNLDIFVRTETRPGPGETVLGHAYEERCGGKGANQALAAAAEGASTALITALGDDDAGRRISSALSSTPVRVVPLILEATPTGRAVITTTPDGENTIVVVPGASAGLDAGFVITSLGAASPPVVLAQAEISMATLQAAADWCDGHGVRFVLNASPIRDGLDRLLERADPVVVNLHESAVLTGLDPDPEALVEHANQLSKVARSAVVTSGSRGAAFAGDGVARCRPTERVTVVDTTGAGDAFAGALAAALAQGAELADAVAQGSAAGARAVQFFGANQLVI
jgi:ribokinase